MQNVDPDIEASRSLRGPDLMAAELAQRSNDLVRAEDIWRAVTLSATELLRSLDPDHAMPNVMALIGAAVGASRISTYEVQGNAEGRLAVANHYSWTAPDIEGAANTRGQFHPNASVEHSASLLMHLVKGEVQNLIAREALPPLKRLLDAQGIVSMLLIPIFVDRQWWGEIAVDDCQTERRWSAIEIDALKTVAELIGSAVTHAHTLRDLADANRIIDNSLAVLYRLDAEAPHPLKYVSRNITRYGYNASDLISASTRYLELFHPDDLPDVMRDIAGIVNGHVPEAARERRILLADGRYLWFEDRTRPLYDENHKLTAIEGLLIDINERKMAEAKIARYSTTDPLTGLANRNAFMVELGNAFTAAERGATSFAVHYLDLDRFKDINDVFGHSKGDELLKLVAQRLKSVGQTNDVIARFGGDEFAILQTGASDRSDAEALATRIIHELAKPYDLDTQLNITASIGIAIFSRDAAGPDEMVKQADIALYHAKDVGRNQYQFHSEDLDNAIVERVTLARDLRLALERCELELYYQPQVEASSGKIVGLEALARWHHPTHGLLCPTRFIPIAEVTGLILPLGRWVIEDVCRQLASWRADGLIPPTLAINVSAAQLIASPEFISDLERSFRKWNIEPGTVELELTETVLMETTRKHGGIIDQLRALGVQIAIDDFGTGYSSLGYLRSFRVNHLKIAQEFIHNLRPNSGDAAIVRAAISLAHELEIKVIAEGVETAFQIDLLTQAGCQYVQGFYFSHPVPATQAGELLGRGRIVPVAAEAQPMTSHGGHTPTHGRSTPSISGAVSI